MPRSWYVEFEPQISMRYCAHWLSHSVSWFLTNSRNGNSGDVLFKIANWHAQFYVVLSCISLYISYFWITWNLPTLTVYLVPIDSFIKTSDPVPCRSCVCFICWHQSFIKLSYLNIVHHDIIQDVLLNPRSMDVKPDILLIDPRLHCVGYFVFYVHFLNGFQNILYTA